MWKNFDDRFNSENSVGWGCQNLSIPMDKSNFFRPTTQPNLLKILLKISTQCEPTQPNPWVDPMDNCELVVYTRAAAATTVDMCWTVVCRVSKTYTRCLIVILVVALAQISFQQGSKLVERKVPRLIKTSVNVKKPAVRGASDAVNLNVSAFSI